MEERFERYHPDLGAYHRRANGGPLRRAMGWAGEFGFTPIAVGEGRVVCLGDLAAGEVVAALGAAREARRTFST